ncbi:MAG: hypothetical protein IPK54_01370 [Dokdonella sp.]|uniref:hypothetical protein n=1 Tax=Dokdonella sp. TaxID=2291710 RepID=UPI0009628967|nr:hypothetical protein [Dokdonella sp.]MBK8122234.1 hypothetical protein [Dokdonella sp.]OJY87668.1 MAG: hypothetical protein BGP25_00710 [Xanthomonadales bacterium 63-13]
MSTLPAKVLVLALVRPSLSAFAAVRTVVAVDDFVVRAGARALPARLLEVLLAPLFRSTKDAVRITL